jgi:hypothetical protein
MSRVLIDYCPIEELMSLPGVGAKVADTILEMWEAKGDLELEGLRHVPYLRLTLQLIRCLDFAPLDDGEELGERSGSLDEEHRERDRSVDQLVEEWEFIRNNNTCFCVFCCVCVCCTKKYFITDQICTLGHFYVL